jgi:hypothetical protein
MTFKRSYKIPIYSGRLYIILCDSIKEASKKEGLNLDDTGLDLCDAVCCVRELNHCVIFEHNPTPGVIAHECKHFINYLFIQKGVELDLYNDEHECYLLEWAVNKVHEVINKMNN